MIVGRTVDQEYIKEEPDGGGRSVGVEGNLPTEFRGDDASQDQAQETAQSSAWDSPSRNMEGLMIHGIKVQGGAA